MEKKSKWPAAPDTATARPGGKKRHALPERAPKVSPAPATDKDAGPEPAGRGFLEPELGDPGSRADNDIERS